MRQWYVFQPVGNHVGPVPTDLLVRDILAGKLPRESHVAAPGNPHWFPALTVPEIAQALSMGATAAPGPPSVPPASGNEPPPITVFPPRAPAEAPKADDKKSAGLDPRYRTLPIVIFGGCTLVALVLFVVGLVAKPGEAAQTAGSSTSVATARATAQPSK